MKKNDQIQLIFGMKLRQLRQSKGYSLLELSTKSGISVSYLNEIEKGKKYPKADKILVLAEAFGVSFDQLVSLKVNKTLAPALQAINSDLLSQFPLELFGIEASKLVEIIAASPAKVNAFITTLIEIARSYQLSSEQFYFRALRAYQELHLNYFEDLENAVKLFAGKFNLHSAKDLKVERLAVLLETEFACKVELNHDFKAAGLREFRALTVPGKPNVFYLNPELSDTQKAFQLIREIAYSYLNLKERPLTSTIVRVKTFEEALNNFKASYFANALQMPYELVIEDVKKWFFQKKWNEDFLLRLIAKYKVSPETFLYRITTVIPQEFGIQGIFFLRAYNKRLPGEYLLDKELHLGQQHRPHASGLDKTYCRRWAAIRSLSALTRLREKNRGKVQKPLIIVQRSHYLNTELDYLVISIARPHQSDLNSNSSVTIGFSFTKELPTKIKFAEDEKIQELQVNHICEACSLTDCRERAAKPIDLDELTLKARQEEKLNAFYLERGYKRNG